MRYSLDIELDILPRINSADHTHWRTRNRERDLQRGLIRGYTLRNHPKTPLPKARVRLTRYSSVEPDPGNMGESWKHVLDGLTFAGIIEDDRSSVIGTPEFVWQKARPKRGKIRIQVWGQG